MPGLEGAARATGQPGCSRWYFRISTPGVIVGPQGMPHVRPARSPGPDVIAPRAPVALRRRSAVRASCSAAGGRVRGCDGLLRWDNGRLLARNIRANRPTLLLFLLARLSGLLFLLSDLVIVGFGHGLSVVRALGTRPRCGMPQVPAGGCAGAHRQDALSLLYAKACNPVDKPWPCPRRPTSPGRDGWARPPPVCISETCTADCAGYSGAEWLSCSILRSLSYSCFGANKDDGHRGPLFLPCCQTTV